MKKGIHPENYRHVVMQDISTGFTILTKSTANTKDTIKWEDGNEYPLIKMEISSDSHPYYTGKKKLIACELIKVIIKSLSQFISF